MENKLASFAKAHHLFYSNCIDEIAEQCQVEVEELKELEIKDAVFTNDDHNMLVVFFTKNDSEEVYRFGNEDWDEDPTEEIQVNQGLEFVYKRIWCSF